jgi:uncharacterized membrane protein YhfC
MILVAVCSIWLWQRGKRSLWPQVWWGVLAWVISVAVKTAASLPTTSLMQRHSGNPLIWAYVGLLTGVFECGIPLLLIMKSRLNQADWNGAVAFGIGFGGIEAFLLGLGSLVSIVLLLAAPGLISVGTRDAMVQTLRNEGIISIFLAIVERGATLFVHVLASVLLIYAVRRRQQRWFWLAFVYKTAVDGIAGGWATLAWKVTESTGKVAVLELVVVLFALIALAALPRLKARFADLEKLQESASALVSGDPKGLTA